MIDCEIEKSPENGEEVLISSSTCKTEQFEPDDSDDYYEDGALIEEISCDIVQERCSKTAENRQECICGGTVFKDGRAYSGDDYVTYCNNLDNILLCGYFGNTSIPLEELSFEDLSCLFPFASSAARLRDATSVVS